MANQWQQIESLFHAAVKLPAAERSAFLAEACAGDDELRFEVEALLAADDSAAHTTEMLSPTVIAEGLAQANPLLGARISRYTILRRIGAGGMGEVFLAKDTQLNRHVALKLLPEKFASDVDRVRRFEQEAQTVSALNHPNILTLFDLGRSDGQYFMATEFIDGQTVRDHLRTQPRVPVTEALEIVLQICHALTAAHEAGIIHRDIKPENIMLRRDGYVKVLDFGLAKLTELSKSEDGSQDDEDATLRQSPLDTPQSTMPGMVMGTATYMSPEQARGERVDIRTDIFSLGIVLYEMLEGRTPFVGANTFEVVAAILDREPAPMMGVPSELQRIVDKALRKDRTERYQNIKYFQLDLKNMTWELAHQGRLKATNTSHENAAQTVSMSPVTTDKLDSRRTASSAEYLINQIKSHRLAAIVSLAIFVLTASVVLFYFQHQPPLTDKDTILLVDFKNKTNDAIFDGTLKQGLAMQLEQSPFLSLYPDSEVRQALRLMERSPDDSITTIIGREICERQGLKALIAGTISSLGSHYVITLEAVGGHNGAVLAREQIEAESKEQVLKTLSTASTRMREKLGESLSSIQTFDAPLEQATTSSLDALKSYYLADEERVRGRYAKAIPFLQRAIELDPNFALAHTVLAEAYFLTRKSELAAESIIKAFALKDRVSDRERFLISDYYASFYEQDWEKATEILSTWRKIYPRDFLAINNLSFAYLYTGRYEQAIEESREATRVLPHLVAAQANLVALLVYVNRFEEAREVARQMQANKVDGLNQHYNLYQMAFITGDTEAMKKAVEWAKERNLLIDWEARSAAFAGKLSESHEYSRRYVELARQRDLKEVAALSATTDALQQAFVGNVQRARELASNSLLISRSGYSLTRPFSPLSNAAFVFALCGDNSKTQPLIDELNKRHPKSTPSNTLWLPMIGAAMELQRGNANHAIELLQPTHLYEAAAEFQPQYLRGQAYLKLGKGNEAAAEFQKILTHRGYAPLSVLYSLAYLGLGRAMLLQGDSTKAKHSYEEFFRFWKDANADLPVLIQAKNEYEKIG